MEEIKPTVFHHNHNGFLREENIYYENRNIFLLAEYLPKN